MHDLHRNGKCFCTGRKQPVHGLTIQRTNDGQTRKVIVR